MTKSDGFLRRTWTWICNVTWIFLSFEMETMSFSVLAFALRRGIKTTTTTVILVAITE